MNLLVKYKIIVAVLLLLVSTACEKDYLDVNTDPNNPSVASESAILPAAQVAYAFAFSGNYDRMTSSFVKQYVNTRYDRYSLNPAETGLVNSWQFDIFGGALKDLDVIIKQGTTLGNWHYVGIAKLQKAYVYSMMVDLFGDLPYTDALNGEENLYPAYEDDAAIYDKLFTLIDEGLADLDKTSGISPNTNDLVYPAASSAAWVTNSLPRWKRMGSSLKLKMYNQIRLADPARAQTAINQLITENNMIATAAQDFQFAFGTAVSPDNRHPNYQADYENASRENYMSSYFDTLLTNLNDPRIPYYFTNQAPGFQGRTPGSGASAGSDANTRTVFGLYPVGGRFGSVGAVNQSSGQGNAPYRMITSYMVQFIIAEAQLMLNNDVAAARAAFKAGMEAALAKINAFATGQPQIPATGAGSVEEYVTARLAEFDAAATNEEKLALLITQKYISQFNNGIESYNDYRRTGYPEIGPIPDPLGVFPLRLPYDPDEFQGPNPPAQVLQSVPVFWDIN
jgi:hypothetical protein